MAVTLSRNLKLRIDSNLTANAQYNLARLDLLGSTFLVDSEDTLRLQSTSDIFLEPESANLGGSGVGGDISLGSSGHTLDQVGIWALLTKVSGGPLQLEDQATGGTQYLSLQYKSDLAGVVDTSAGRTLSIDTEGADRELLLGGSLMLSGGDLSFSLSGTSNLNLPVSGTLSTLAGTETLTNKTIDAENNVLLNISDSSIRGGAGIEYSKLNLTGSLVNSDVASGAGISYTKLQLTGQVRDSDLSVSAAISRSKIATGNPGWVLVNDGSGNFSEEPTLAKSRGGAGQDQSNVTYPTSGVLVTEQGTETLQNKTINGTQNTLVNVPFSALNLTNSITDADIQTGAGVEYSKLNLTGSLVNSDISSLASIDRLKLNNGTPDTAVWNDGSGHLAEISSLPLSVGGTGGTSQATALANILPSQTGNTGKVLQTDGASASWVASVGTGTVTSVSLTAPSEFSVSGSPVTSSGTLAVTKATQAANAVWAGPTSGSVATPAFRSLVLADLPTSIPYSQLTLTGQIVDADVSATASIALSKLAGLTVSRALASDGSGVVSVSATTSTELGYLSGTTSAVQTQLNGKAPTSRMIATTSPLTGGGSLASDLSLAIPQASGSQAGYLAAADWTTFNGKQPAGSYVTTSRQVATGTGLSGGGDLSSDRTISLANTAVSPGSYGSASTATTFTVNQQGQLSSAGSTAIAITSSQVTDFATASQTQIAANRYSVIWPQVDGTGIVVTHNLGTLDVNVQIYEIDTGETIMVDSVVRNSTSQVTLTSSQAPNVTGWQVLVLKA